MQMVLSRSYDPYSPHVADEDVAAPEPVESTSPVLEPTPQPGREKRGRRARSAKKADAPVMADLKDHTAEDLEAALAALDASQDAS